MKGHPRFVIRLSRPPAIPTFFAHDALGYYAASNESLALHYTQRARAEQANDQDGVRGVVEPCACSRFN